MPESGALTLKLASKTPDSWHNHIGDQVSVNEPGEDTFIPVITALPSVWPYGIGCIYKAVWQKHSQSPPHKQRKEC